MNVRKLTLLTCLLLLLVVLTGGILTTAQTEELVDLTKGLVAYWSFDEGDGDIVFDESGNHNDAGLFCKRDNCFPPRWAKGKVGFAIELDGDDCLQVHHDDSLTFGKSPFTITGWIKSSNGEWAHHSYEYILGKGSFDKPTGYHIAITRSHLHAKTPDGGFKGSIPPTDQWFYFTVVFRRNQVEMYLNGTLGHTSENFERSNWDNSGKLVMGAYHCKYGHFAGILDEIRIYNRALPSQEIKDLYDKTSSSS